MKHLAFRVVLMSFGLALGFVIAELGLRVAGYQPIFEVYSKPSILWQHDELLGWSHTPNSEDLYIGPRPWPIEWRTPVKINSASLRGPEIEALPPGGVRILAAGDSRTVALEVAYDETYPAILEKLLGELLGVPVQVINAGVRGYGSDQSYLYYRDRGHRFEPDLVLFLHSSNDVRNNVTLHRMRRPFGKAAFRLEEDGSLELVGTPVSRYPICSSYSIDSSFQVRRRDTATQRIVCRLQLALFDRSALFTFATIWIQQRPDLLRFLYQLGAPEEASGVWPHPEAAEPEGGELPYDRALTTRILENYAREVRGRGAEFVLFAPGNLLSMLGLESLQDAGARVVVLDDAFEGWDRTQLRFQHDGHYNATGHRLMAEFLAPILAPVIEARLRERAPK